MRATIHAERLLSGHVFVSGLAGASAARSTRASDEADDDTDLYLLYGARVGVRASAVTTSVAFIGRAYPTASGPNTERTVNQFALDVSANHGRVRPLAGVRLYQDRLLRPLTPATFTLGVVVQ